MEGWSLGSEVQWWMERCHIYTVSPPSTPLPSSPPLPLLLSPFPSSPSPPSSLPLPPLLFFLLGSIYLFIYSDAMNWLQTFYTKLQQQAPDVSFGINFSLNGASPTDPTVLAVTDHVDYIMDEAGYTNWGFGLPPPQAWDDISTWIINIQSKGKQYPFFSPLPSLLSSPPLPLYSLFFISSF